MINKFSNIRYRINNFTNIFFSNIIVKEKKYCNDHFNFEINFTMLIFELVSLNIKIKNIYLINFIEIFSLNKMF